MSNSSDETPILNKIRELCGVIAAQPDFAEIGRKIESFMNDPAARELYEKVLEHQERLASIQENGTDISDRDFALFEVERDKLVANPIARGFLEAQHSMREIRETVNKYVAKTFEVGRIPEVDDFDECGESCDSCGGH